MKAKLYTLRNSHKKKLGCEKKHKCDSPPIQTGGPRIVAPKIGTSENLVYLYKDFTLSDSFPSKRPAGQRRFHSGVIGDEQMKVDVIIASMLLCITEAVAEQAGSQSIYR